MNAVAITGASGFVGRHLVARLAQAGGTRIRVLSRGEERGLLADFPEVEWVRGDLLDESSLQALVESCDAVVNLAYLWSGGEEKNVRAARNLLTACKQAGARRLIHCSTAMVANAANGSHRIDEQAACNPVSEYGICKLRVEQVFAQACSDQLDVAILRPTAVFGPGGKNLAKLAADLKRKSRFANYLRSSLFGARRMNLVHVENVVDALIFLMQVPQPLRGQPFIVSDSAVPANNFRDVERVLMEELELPPYALPAPRLPQGLLALVLAGMKQDAADPRADYDARKLASLGFAGRKKFEDGLREYARWSRDHG